MTEIYLQYSITDAAWIAAVPYLPGCLADGPTPEKAIAALRVVAQQWVETAEADGREVPTAPLDLYDPVALARRTRDLLRGGA